MPPNGEFGGNPINTTKAMVGWNFTQRVLASTVKITAFH
jgi:hypothetical protein